MLAVCNNLGLLADHFFPTEAGRNYKSSLYLQPLQGHRDDFVKTATELETAYALAAGDERVTVRHDEIALRCGRFVRAGPHEPFAKTRVP